MAEVQISGKHSSLLLSSDSYRKKVL